MSYLITTKGSNNVRILATESKREAARAKAKELNGTVRTEEDFAQLVVIGRATPALPGTFEDGTKGKRKPGSILAVAEAIAKEGKKRMRLAAPVKTPKRVATDAAVLGRALQAFDKAHTSFDKVGAVRFLASWQDKDGTKLQRRDVFAVIRQHAIGVNIADATISTQFQLVRSGKWTPKAK